MLPEALKTMVAALLRVRDTGDEPHRCLHASRLDGKDSWSEDIHQGGARMRTVQVAPAEQLW